MPLAKNTTGATHAPTPATAASAICTSPPAQGPDAAHHEPPADTRGNERTLLLRLHLPPSPQSGTHTLQRRHVMPLIRTHRNSDRQRFLRPFDVPGTPQRQPQPEVRVVLSWIGL